MKWDAPLKMTRSEPLWVLRETNHGASLKSLQKSTQKSLWVWVQILMSLCPLQELAVWTGKAKPLVLLLFRFTSLLSTTSSKRHHFINYALFPGSSSNDKPFSLFMFVFLPNSFVTIILTHLKDINPIWGYFKKLMSLHVANRQIPAALLPIQILLSVPEKAEGDGSCMWAHNAHVWDVFWAPALCGTALALVATWGMKRKRKDLSLTLSLSLCLWNK